MPIYLLRVAIIYSVAIIFLTNINLIITLNNAQLVFLRQIVYGLIDCTIIIIFMYLYNFKHRQFMNSLTAINVIILILFFSSFIDSKVISESYVSYTGIDVIKRLSNTLMLLPMLYFFSPSRNFYKRAILNSKNTFAMCLGIISALIINSFLSLFAFTLPSFSLHVKALLLFIDVVPFAKNSFLMGIFVRASTVILVLTTTLSFFDRIIVWFNKIYQEYIILKERITVAFIINVLFMLATTFIFMSYTSHNQRILIFMTAGQYLLVFTTNLVFYILGYSFANELLPMWGSVIIGFIFVAFTPLTTYIGNMKMLLTFSK